MAGLRYHLRFEVNTDTKALAQLAGEIPDIAQHMFSKVGTQGRLTLKGQLLSGQEINLRAYPKGPGGRHTIKHHALKGGKGVYWTSFPVNLFERGRMLRSGRREPAKRIITGKFKALVNSNLQRWVDQSSTETVDKWAKKA